MVGVRALVLLIWIAVGVALPMGTSCSYSWGPSSGRQFRVSFEW